MVGQYRLIIFISEIVCGKPPVVPHSHMSWNRNTSVGSNVFYECEEGYHKMGTGNMSVCTENGLWSDVSFKCEGISSIFLFFFYPCEKRCIQNSLGSKTGMNLTKVPDEL